LAATAAVGTWLHWLLRKPAHLGEPFRLASAWALVGCLLATGSGFFDVPPAAPALLATLLMIGALGLVAVWFGFAAVRTGADRHGHVALAALVLLYVCVRASPLGSGLSSEADVIVAIAWAFALQFVSELLQRAKLTALEQPAIWGARTIPLAACLLVLWIA